jgi:hypothetical protein
LCVSDARTTVDVGTRRRGVPSVALEPYVALDDYDFFPGERVVAHVDFRDDDGGGEVRVGVVRSADCDDHTVRVSWLKPSSPGEEPEVECEETVNAYYLGAECSIFYGNVVVRLPSSLESATGSDGGAAAQHGKGVAAPTAAAAGASADLSWVGYVIDLCHDGHVQVSWGDGSTSKVCILIHFFPLRSKLYAVLV